MIGSQYKLALGLALLVAATPSYAKKDPVYVEHMRVKDKDSVTLDPAEAYIYFRSSSESPVLMIMRYPSEAETAQVQQDRDEAFAKEFKRYTRTLAEYERDYEEYITNGPSPKVPKRPTKPLEPRDENFVYPSFGQLAKASLNWSDRFSKAHGGASTVLIQLTPGTYRIYGPVLETINGTYTGKCLCMGSVKFEVRKGEITDLGEFLDTSLTPNDGAMAIDARIADFPRRMAEFQAVGKLPNYYGIEVGRIDPIPGIVTYYRDQVVDLRKPPVHTANAAIAADAGQP